MPVEPPGRVSSSYTEQDSVVTDDAEHRLIPASFQRSRTQKKIPTSLCSALCFRNHNPSDRKEVQAKHLLTHSLTFLLRLEKTSVVLIHVCSYPVTEPEATAVNQNQSQKLVFLLDSAACHQLGGSSQCYKNNKYIKGT